jgi:hypothetical protein
VMGLFMIGSFNETQETLQQTFEFINQAYMTDIQVTFYTPLPGTASWQQWPQYGTFDEKSHAAFHVRPSFIPKGFTAEELIALQKKIYLKFYLKPKNLLRYFRFLLNPKTALRLLQNVEGFIAYLLSDRKT